MGFVDKARDKAQELKGEAKKTAGDATGDKRLKHEGQADQTKGNAKQAGENIKDAVDPDGNH